MKSRVIKIFVRFILALIMAPVILLGWIMICIGDRKKLPETNNTMEDFQFYVVPELDTIEIEECNN